MAIPMEDQPRMNTDVDRLLRRMTTSVLGKRISSLFETTPTISQADQ